MMKEIWKRNVAVCQVPFCASMGTKPQGGGTKDKEKPAGKPQGTGNGHYDITTKGARIEPSRERQRTVTKRYF